MDVTFVRLRTVFLHVTKACDLQCDYCYFSARRPLPDELSTDELGVVLADLAHLAPRKVVFTGGEPLLRRDILELLRILRDHDPTHRVVRCLNTNGRGMTAELARSLVGLADEVRVSIDGLRETNDAHRGRGSFDAAVGALETLYRAGFEPKALVTVTRSSLPDLPALVRLLRDMRISRININPFRPVGRGLEVPDLRVTPAAIAAVLREVAPELSAPSATPSVPPASAGCGVGQFLNILPDGDVHPCHVLTDRRFRCGNVRERSLREICAERGLVARLAEVQDGRAFAAEDSRLAELLQRPAPCMGEVLARVPDSPAWRHVLDRSGTIELSSPTE